MRSRVFRRPGRRRHARTARCTQKSPPRRRWQAVGYHKTLHLCQAETDDQRRTFPPPRRWWQPCVTPYFADLGVGDMRGARASNIHRHPGGGGRLSVTTKRLPSPPSWRQYQPGATPHRQCRERQRATPSAPSPLSFPRSSLTLPPQAYACNTAQCSAISRHSPSRIASDDTFTARHSHSALATLATTARC